MTPRYDPRPLLRQAELGLNPKPGRFPDGDHGQTLEPHPAPTDSQIADHFAVSLRSIQRWRHGNQLSPRTADRLATRLGIHPCSLWSDWYETL